MNVQRAFCLTSEPNGGYLSPLFPPRRVERDANRSRPVPSPETPSHQPAAERLNQRRSLSMLARLARSTRGRIGAALLAFGGGAMMENRADAATIIMQGEIVPAADVTEQPEYALALTNGIIDYTIGHADGTADATMTWFGVKSPGYTLEQYVEAGSDVPNTVIAPDQLDDGNRSEFLLTEAALPELNSLRYYLDARHPSGVFVDLHDFLENAEVRAGFGPLTGDPRDLDEATAMTDGPVMRAFYSDNVELDDAWIFRSIKQEANAPEPSTLGLAGAALAAGLTSRRRFMAALHK